MKVASALSSFRKERRPVVLAAGFFDGVHRGHRQVIGRTVSAARRIGGVAWVLTFKQHPMKVLRPELAPRLLISNEQKLKQLERLGADGCLFLPFTRSLARLEPEAFVDLLATAIPTLARILVGENWRFGRREKGDVVMLTDLAGQHHIKVTRIQPVLMSGHSISSTRIRGEVLNGNLKEAATMLGRPFSITGIVVKGWGMGRKLGTPTANLKTDNEVTPPYGIYAVRVTVGRRCLEGVASIGVRPTFPGSETREPAIEVHLLNFKGNLYGKDLEIFFIKRLRAERKFKSVEALKKQIAVDIQQAVRVLKKKSGLQNSGARRRT